MSGLITNLKVGAIVGKATTLRSNFGFDSLTEFAGRYFGTLDGKIYELGGEDDAGVDIDASIKTLSNCFGVVGDKRLRFVYLKVESYDAITLKVEYLGAVKDRKTDLLFTRTYTIDTYRTGAQIIKIPIRRAEYGGWIDITVSNTNGAYFSLSEIHVVPRILPAGRGRRHVKITDS